MTRPVRGEPRVSCPLSLILPSYLALWRIRLIWLLWRIRAVLVRRWVSRPDRPGRAYPEGGSPMAQAAVPVARPRPVPVCIPLREILPWAVFAAVVGLLVLYFVGTEQGATSLIGGAFGHGVRHGRRHLLGFPLPPPRGGLPPPAQETPA